MFDALARFSRRRPRLVCFGITSLLPWLCALAVPISILVVHGNQLGNGTMRQVAVVLLCLTAAQLGPVAVSVALGLYLLPTWTQWGLNLIWGMLSVPIIFACAVVTAYFSIP